MRWLYAKLAHAGDNPFLRAVASLQGSSYAKDHHVLSTLSWRPRFAGWSRPGIQHDASELLIHFIPKIT